MLIRVVDFETTGIEPDSEIVEAGWCDVDTNARTVSAPRSMLVCPAASTLTPEVMAVHHITPDDLVGCPPPAVAFDTLRDGASVFAAHNSKFERQFFQGPATWICTLKVARRVWPEAPGHSNMVLRYWRGLALDRALAEPAHRAAPDAYVTAHPLLDLLAAASVEDMIAWEGQPSLLPRITFGKHRGKKWSEAPRDYLEWMLRQDFDEDVKFTAREALKSAPAGLG